MSESAIRLALEAHLNAMPGKLPTVWQNKPVPQGFDAAAPHQKAFMLRSPPESIGLEELNSRHRGYLQVSLCYPSGDGTFKIETYAKALQDHFPPGLVLQGDGVKVRIRGRAAVADPISISPYVVPVSIRYETIF
jgi:hypothetical protein